MKLSHTLGLTALAAAVAASGIASAAATYQVNGYVVSATDAAGGALCAAFQQAVGNPSSIWVYVPGTNAVGMSIESPASTATTTSGGKTTNGVASTNSCIAQTTTATTTLPFGTTPIVFNCYTNVSPQKAPPTTASATLTSTFAATATHTGTSQTAAGSALNVETTSTLTVPGYGSCNTVTDATWVAK